MKIGVIGGSGLDNPDILQEASDKVVETEYGSPTSPLKVGSIAGVEVALLARHGRSHTVPPTHVNNRANIAALRDFGCTHVLATTACGSLREEIARGDFVIVDQFIDFTRLRKVSFDDEFPEGGRHTPMSDPFHEDIRNAMIGSAGKLGIRHHERGTVVTIEGNRFSTRAESHMFRSWGADVINMSVAPECILANEAGLPYGVVAMATDYDCWKEDEAPVSWDDILEVFKANVEKVTKLLVETITVMKEAQ